MKSSNDVQKRERTRLLELANEYRSKGYEVFIEPGIEARPQFLGDYRLDLVAISPQDKVVVEVKSRDSLERSAYLEEIAREIEKHPSWRFDLVLTNPRVRTDFSEEWTLLPLGELNARFLQAVE